MSQVEQGLEIPVAGVTLQADLVVPDRPAGLIVFAHGSGSGRHSSLATGMLPASFSRQVSPPRSLICSRPTRSWPMPGVASSVSTSGGFQSGSSR